MHPADVIQAASSPRPGPIRGFVPRKDPVGWERRRSAHLATVAHEIRNAMAPLSTALQILGARRSGAEDAKLLQVALRQLGQLAILTEDLLDLGRAANDGFRLSPQRVDVHGLVAGVVASARLLATAKGQVVMSELPSTPLFVQGDPTRLAQALQNVLGNAVKFTPPSGHIAVRARIEGTHVLIRVTDSGIGIAAPDVERIFELFSAREGEHVRPEGFGIGLALARQLVELHGGRVTAASPGAGQGATFTIALPLAAC